LESLDQRLAVFLTQCDRFCTSSRATLLPVTIPDGRVSV
jgi:hypothetical protein